ncbi:MAG TPA: hypothetical protein VM536_07855 [Chloroflexia bacterium]|nr:hypothetical protein [Chloroflexia bacterium]
MSSRPTGTVPFLVTGIAGSSTRWEHAPEQQQAAFAPQAPRRRHKAGDPSGIAFVPKVAST